MTPDRRLPTAPEWFERRRIDDTLTLIREPHTTAIVAANVWHVRGTDRDLFIDCGLGVASLRTAFPDLFERDPILVLTHGHPDHAGSAHEFDSVWAHESEPTSEPYIRSLSVSDFAADAGLDVDAFEGYDTSHLITARPMDDFDPDTHLFRTPEVTRRLSDGDVIDLGSRAFRIVHLPGHTAGSIGLYEPDREELFSGDVVYDDGTPLIDYLPGCSVDAYLASIRRILSLPLTTVHGGHGESFDRPRLKDICRNYLESRQ